MKRLILIRHAKSDWEDSGLKDFDRPLNSRGHRVAPRMGLFLKENGIQPEKIFTSTAVRALTTTEYISEQLGLEDDVIENDELYHASARKLLAEITGADNSLNAIAFVGHNPDFTYFIEYVTGEEIGNLPTCGVAVIDFEFDSWEMVSEKTGNLFQLYLPKELGM